MPNKVEVVVSLHVALLYEVQVVANTPRPDGLGKLRTSDQNVSLPERKEAELHTNPCGRLISRIVLIGTEIFDKILIFISLAVWPWNNKSVISGSATICASGLLEPTGEAYHNTELSARIANGFSPLESRSSINGEIGKNPFVGGDNPPIEIVIFEAPEITGTSFESPTTIAYEPLLVQETAADGYSRTEA